MNIVLIGYRCTGKTTIGKKVAEVLGIPFYDTDELVERQSGRTIREIIEASGWQTFRNEEKAVIKTLSKQNDCVIALGGGAVLDEANVRGLKPGGFFVWLIADVETIVRRMKDDAKSITQRPALSDSGMYEEVDRILMERYPIYKSAADMSVDTANQAMQDIVAEICRQSVRRPVAATGGTNVG
jgi:shikimate kinase